MCIGTAGSYLKNFYDAYFLSGIRIHGYPADGGHPRRLTRAKVPQTAFSGTEERAFRQFILFEEQGGSYTVCQ